MNGDTEPDRNADLFEITGKFKFPTFQKYFIYLTYELLTDPHTFRSDVEWREDTIDDDLCYVVDIEKIVSVNSEDGIHLDNYDISFLQTFFTKCESKTFFDWQEGFDELNAIVTKFAVMLNIVSGHYNQDENHRKIHNTDEQLTKFRFFTNIISEEFWISVLIKKSDFESDGWCVQPTFWEKTIKKEFLCMKCRKPFTMNKLDQFDDGIYCHQCYCDYKCTFREECFTTNKERMEKVLEKVEKVVVERGFVFEGCEIKDRNSDELPDSYASFYLTKEDKIYLCEVSSMFFEKNSEDEKNDGRN